MHSVLAFMGSSIDLFAAADFGSVFGRVWPYLVMLLGFSLIVFVHELGHFLVAKWADVRVERFAVGFGRELFGFTKGETRYSFNILPVGGYVKMLGQEDFDDKAKELMFSDDPRSFVNKPVSHRMAIVSAGVVMNILFACLLFMIAFMVGMKAISTRIAYVEPDSPAERAGILPGDVIKEINGNRIRDFREVFYAVMLADPHANIDFLIQRNGGEKDISVKPENLIPENTREARRLVVGIVPGVTREIDFVGPGIDTSLPESPHVGDVLDEIDGVKITDENVSEVVNTLAYASADVAVERKDPDHPDAAPRRVHVTIPPILQLYPQDDAPDAISVLGLAPLVTVSQMDPRGRANAAGLEIGDTILSWDDVLYPTRGTVVRSIKDNPERDIHFKVKRLDGRLVEGFVRPKQNYRGPATLQALCEATPDNDNEASSPRALFSDVRYGGVADTAGIENGDSILSCGNLENPTAAQVNRLIRVARDPLAFATMTKDGHRKDVTVRPVPGGSIDATFELVAEDTLRTSDVVPTINGKPSPAAQAGIPDGALITAVNGEEVKTWRDLINAFRAHAGSTVSLSYLDRDDHPRTSDFAIPQSIRTLLGVGPEARIVSINGQRTVMYETNRGPEEVSVGYRKGTRTMLEKLVGQSDVTVEYRATPLSQIESKHIHVTEGMVDPWLGRVAFSPNISVKPETTLLKGDNALDAIWIGLHKTYFFMVQVYRTIERIFFSKSVPLESVSGPLGIFDIGGKAAQAGFVQFIFFMAIISANLAVINFLPLPIVDGGLMVFLIIEKIKGSPVSMRVQVATQMIGLFLIIGVFIFVTFNDAMRMWG